MITRDPIPAPVLPTIPMTTTVTLDPNEARPLTNREISKVLCSIIGGVVTSYPDVKARVPDILQIAKAGTVLEFAERTAKYGIAETSWEVALIATVSGLRGWCNPEDVDSALEWVDHNLDRIFNQLAGLRQNLAGSLAKHLPS